MSSTTLIAVIYSIATLLILFIIFKARHKSVREEINLKPIRLISIPIIIIMGISLNLIITVLMGLLPFSTQLIDNYKEASQFTQDTSIVAFLAIVLLVPIVEEVVFRGLLQNRCSKGIPIVATVILQAIIFGLIHGTVLWFSYATLIGIVLGLLAYKQKSILGCVILHISVNGLSFLMNIFKIEFNNITAIVTLVVSLGLFTCSILLLFSKRFNTTKSK